MKCFMKRFMDNFGAWFEKHTLGTLLLLGVYGGIAKTIIKAIGGTWKYVFIIPLSIFIIYPFYEYFSKSRQQKN